VVLAPEQPPLADLQHRAAGIVVPPGQGDHVPVHRLVEHDLLPSPHRLDRAELIAVLRRLLEAHLRGGLLHPQGQGPRDVAVLPLQEADRLVDAATVLLGGDPLLAGPLASADVELEADPRLVRWKPVVAGPHREDPTHHLQGGVHRPHVAERTEVPRAVPHQVAGGEDPGERLVGDPDERVLLVVLEQDVVPGEVGLDLHGLQDQGLLLGGREEVIEVDDLADQGAELAAAVVPRFLEIGADPGAEVLGLAHVDDLSGPVLHQVHA
jgi:hypothetical protein